MIQSQVIKINGQRSVRTRTFARCSPLHILLCPAAQQSATTGWKIQWHKIVTTTPLEKQQRHKFYQNKEGRGSAQICNKP
jgi:hypothetical protein